MAELAGLERPARDAIEGLAKPGILWHERRRAGMRPIHWRRTRLGRYLRHIPRPKHLRGSWLHRKLGEGVLHPDLWHPTSAKVAAGFSLGIFFAMIPMPFQMVPTIVLGYLTRVNLAAALAAVWVTNPITTPPVFFLQYKLGQWVLENLGHGAGAEVVGSWSDLLKEAPLAILCGGVISGIFLSMVSYPVVFWVWESLTNYIMQRRGRCVRRRRQEVAREIFERRASACASTSSMHKLPESHKEPHA